MLEYQKDAESNSVFAIGQALSHWPHSVLLRTNLYPQRQLISPNGQVLSPHSNPTFSHLEVNLPTVCTVINSGPVSMPVIILYVLNHCVRRVYFLVLIHHCMYSLRRIIPKWVFFLVWGVHVLISSKGWKMHNEGFSKMTSRCMDTRWKFAQICTKTDLQMAEFIYQPTENQKRSYSRLRLCLCSLIHAHVWAVNGGQWHSIPVTR